MPTCPHCQSAERQVKDGRNRTGSQRYLCRACGLGYTPEPRAAGHEESVRRQALMLYAGGMSVREAARFACVNHQTVCNWIEAALLLPRSAQGPASPAAHAAVRRGLILQERGWKAGRSAAPASAPGGEVIACQDYELMAKAGRVSARSLLISLRGQSDAICR